MIGDDSVTVNLVDGESFFFHNRGTDCRTNKLETLIHSGGLTYKQVLPVYFCDEYLNECVRVRARLCVIELSSCDLVNWFSGVSYKKQITISQRLSELINQHRDTMKKTKHLYYRPVRFYFDCLTVCRRRRRWVSGADLLKIVSLDTISSSRKYYKSWLPVQHDHLTSIRAWMY